MDWPWNSVAGSGDLVTVLHSENGDRSLKFVMLQTNDQSEQVEGEKVCLHRIVSPDSTLAILNLRNVLMPSLFI